MYYIITHTHTHTHTRARRYFNWIFSLKTHLHSSLLLEQAFFTWKLKKKSLFIKQLINAR